MIRVLLVDNETGFVASLARKLAASGCWLELARSGEDAAARLLQNRDIEVVILNGDGPGMDGFETLRQIKRNTPLVEVIMLAGIAAIDEAVAAVRIGALDYLPRSVHIDKLVSKIEEAAARKRHRDRLMLEIYMKPYLTRRERERLIGRILSNEVECCNR